MDEQSNDSHNFQYFSIARLYYCTLDKYRKSSLESVHFMFHLIDYKERDSYCAFIFQSSPHLFYNCNTFFLFYFLFFGSFTSTNVIKILIHKITKHKGIV